MMIGLVLVTHGNLANEFVAAMQHVVGPQENVATVCIGPEDDMESRRQEILNKVGEVDNGSGAIVLTDLARRPTWQFRSWTKPGWKFWPASICRC